MTVSKDFVTPKIDLYHIVAMLFLHGLLEERYSVITVFYAWLLDPSVSILVVCCNIFYHMTSRLRVK